MINNLVLKEPGAPLLDGAVQAVLNYEGRVIVVAPKGLHGTWVKDTFGDRPDEVLSPQKLVSSGGIKCNPRDLVVLVHVTPLRSPRSKVFRALEALRRRGHPNWLVVADRGFFRTPLEAWGVLRLLGALPETVTRAFDFFRMTTDRYGPRPWQVHPKRDANILVGDWLMSVLWEAHP